MNFPDNILEQTDHFVNGLEDTSHTLIGVNTKKYPVSHGNCFSMKADNGKEYRIVNFYYENLKEGIRRGKLTLPIRLYILGDPSTSRVAVAYDTRIPSQWYSNEFCTTCTPIKYQSFTQRMRTELKIESGVITIKRQGDFVVSSERIKDRTDDWRTDEEKKPIVAANYVLDGTMDIWMGGDVEREIMDALKAEMLGDQK